MSDAEKDLCIHLLDRLRQVQRSMGVQPAGEEALDAPLAGLLDSMGMVEFLTILATDCATSPAAIEQSVRRQFGSLTDLAHSLSVAGLRPEIISPGGMLSRPHSANS